MKILRYYLPIAILLLCFSAHAQLTVYFGLTQTNGVFYGNAAGLTNIPGSALQSPFSVTTLNVSNLVVTNGIYGLGDGITNSGGYHFADTNWSSTNFISRSITNGAAQPTVLTYSNNQLAMVAAPAGSGSGSASNAVIGIMTNGVPILSTGVTNLNFTNGANTTVAASVTGSTVNIGVAATGGGVTASTNFGDQLSGDGANTFWENPANVIRLDDDFFYEDPTILGPWKKNGSSWTVTPDDYAFGDVNHWGVIRMRTTATGTFALAAGKKTIQLGAGRCRWEWIVKMDAVPDANNAFMLQIGLLESDATSAAVVDGVYFMGWTNNANWQTVTVSNSVATTNATTVALGTGWFRLGCDVQDAASATFYIGAAPAQTNTTTIPGGTGRMTGAQFSLTRTTGTTERNQYMDAFHLVYKPTTPR